MPLLPCESLALGLPRVDSEYTGTSSSGGVDVAWYANAFVVYGY